LQIGQLPAVSVTTSACIGHVHDNGGSGRDDASGASADSSSARREISIGRQYGTRPKCLTPLDMGE
jgi:hypothetical protein